MKKITDSDFKYIRQDMYAKGFSKPQRDRLEMGLLGDKDNGQITKQEYEKTRKLMEKNKSQWGLSGKRLEELDEIVEKRMH